MSLDRYQLGEILCTQWSAEMSARFPNADHRGCRQEMWIDGDHYKPFDPVRCVGYHCNRCGEPTNSYGHHDCPDRPAR